MGIKKGTPGRGASERVDSFSYTGVGSGLKGNFNAWLAGEPYWCEEAHEHRDDDPGTKPCLHWMTDGALKCPRCRKARPVKCIGWVPLYREQDAKPIIVIVHESASDLLSGLRFLDYCLVGRVDGVSSVFVRKSDQKVLFTSSKPSRNRPADITQDLLAMWRMPELNEWLSCQRPTRAADAPAVEQPEGGKPVKSWNRFVALGSGGELSGSVAGGELADELADAQVEREQRALRELQYGDRPSTNGKHKSKPPK